MSSIRLLSPAKVNLFLRILAKRDDGYHDLQSVVQPVNLFDEVSVSVGRNEGIELESSGRDVPSGRDNLAVSACLAYLKEASVDAGVSIVIRKKIPVGAGLGGGSSNAAAVLVGLNRILRKFTEDDLLRIATTLGADVPFFIGSTASFTEGTGERVRTLADFPLFHYILLFPGIGVSTRKVYGAWKEPASRPRRADPERLAGEFRRDGFPLENGLEETVFRLFPEILSFREILRSLAARPVLVSGSGSTVFSVFRERERAAEIYEYLRTSGDFEVFFASGISGWHFLAD